MVAAAVVVAVLLLLLFLRIPGHVASVLEPIELPFVSSNPESSWKIEKQNKKIFQESEGQQKYKNS